MFQPRSGVLGTHRKAAVFELIKNGQRFPDGYFWQVELVSFVVTLLKEINLNQTFFNISVIFPYASKFLKNALVLMCSIRC